MDPPSTIWRASGCGCWARTSAATCPSADCARRAGSARTFAPVRRASSSSPADSGGAGPRAGAVHLSLQTPAEHALEPLRDADERIEIDAGVDPLALQEIDEILGRDVPGRPRRVGTAAEAACGRVEH